MGGLPTTKEWAEKFKLAQGAMGGTPASLKYLPVPIWETEVRIAYNNKCTFNLPMAITRYKVSFKFPVLVHICNMHTAEILVFHNGKELTTLTWKGCTYAEYFSNKILELPKVSDTEFTNSLSFLRKNPEDNEEYRSEVYITSIQGLMPGPSIILTSIGDQ